MTSGHLLAILVAGAAAASASAVTQTAHAQSAVAAQSSAGRADAAKSYAWVVASGYLAHEARPNSLALVPPPPAPGSAAQARDDAAAQTGVALQGSPRWALAISDARLTPEQLAQDFSCALGLTLSPQTTPRTLALLLRASPDLAASTFAAKTAYRRARPFMSDGAPSCTPDEEVHLRRDGSYPSGHSALGWGWGLILAELAPDRGDAILARARAFGQSRVVCNVHWQSDVDEGRIVATATIARLHADPQFRGDLEAARAELQAALRQTAAPLPPRCSSEVEVLSKP